MWRRNETRLSLIHIFPEKNTMALLPTTIAGQKVNYIVLDDASDTTTAVKNTRKLLAENKVDVIIGSTTSPNSLAMICLLYTYRCV